jgi:hypothetical protein
MWQINFTGKLPRDLTNITSCPRVVSDILPRAQRKWRVAANWCYLLVN